ELQRHAGAALEPWLPVFDRHHGAVGASDLSLLPLAEAAVAQSLRKQPLRPPGLLWPGAQKHQPVVQTEGPVLPELDLQRRQAKTGPVIRSRDLAEREFRSIAGDFLFQGEAALQWPRLARGPGADPAAARPGAIVLVRLLRRHRGDRTTNA